MAWDIDYCTADELAHYARQTDVDLQTEDALEIGLAITGASGAIDIHCNRQFGVDDAPTTRFYSSKLCSPTVRTVKCDDIMTLGGLVVATNDVAASAIEYTLTPVNNAVKGKPYTGFRLYGYTPSRLTHGEDVAVTATFGWPTVPRAVKMACLLQASRFLARREAPFGIAGSPDQGSEMRLLARVDPDVGVSLMKYVRWWA